MTKNLLSTLLALLMPMIASAYDAEIDGIYYDFWENEAYVTSGDIKYTGDVTIPATVTYEGNTYDVLAVKPYAFQESSVTSVIIPNGAFEIAAYAFDGCSSLTSVTIPESMKNILVGSFSRCSSLTSIYIPSSVTFIGLNAFRDCSSLSEIHISDIAAWCKIEYEGGAFPHADNVYHLFLNDVEITDLVIPEGVTEIALCAFRSFGYLTSVTIPKSVTSLSEGAFSRCYCLETVKMSEGLVTLGDYAFDYCRNLTSITVPNSVTSIGGHAFEKCFKLGTVTVGSGLASIGEKAFEGCNSIKNLNVCITDYSAFCYNNNSIFTQINNQLTLVDGEGNEITEYVVPEDVEAIADYAFQKCTGLTSVVIPEGVTKIGRRVFENCTNLAYVTIPNSVTTFGATPFQGCNNITSIDINCENIGNNVFSSKKKLETIILGEHVKKLANAAFKNCTGIKEIYCQAEEPPTVYSGSFGGVDVASVMLVVPDDSYEAYKAHEVWGQFWIETPTGISLSPTPSDGKGEKVPDGKCFNLAGQRILAPQKGLNIINGKKIWQK